MRFFKGEANYPDLEFDEESNKEEEEEDEILRFNFRLASIGAGGKKREGDIKYRGKEQSRRQGSVSSGKWRGGELCSRG